MARTRKFDMSKDGIKRTTVTLSVRLTARQLEILEIMANGEGTIKRELENGLDIWVNNLEEYAKDFGYIK